MKFIFKTIFKILVLFIILIIPVGLFITFFALNQKQIPVWNIGIRNIVLFSKNYALPIITISYFIATLLTVSLIDKMKVRSIFLLHIPAVLIGVVIIGVFFLIQSNNYPLSLIEKRMYLGYRTFFKENVFNDLRERSVLLMRTDQNQFTVYLYDKVNNSLIIMNNMRVMALSFVLSFLIGSGAIIILAWNASILGLYLASFLRKGLITEFVVRTIGLIPLPEYPAGLLNSKFPSLVIKIPGRASLILSASAPPEIAASAFLKI